MNYFEKSLAFKALTVGVAVMVAPLAGPAYAEAPKEDKVPIYKANEAKSLISRKIEVSDYNQYKIALNHSMSYQAHKPNTLNERPATNPGKGNKGEHPGKGPKPGKGQGKAVDVSFLHLNDTHANLDQVAKRVSVVKEKREENPDTIVVDAGDVFSGTLYFNEFKGQADVKFMNLMQVDVMTFGNHEFDLGSSQEGHRALVDFIKAAHFPFVSSNVDFSKDSAFRGLFNTKIKTNAKDGQIYTGIVKEVDGQKIGFFGLTTEETSMISNPGSIAFQNYVGQARKMVDEFEKMGINKVVALTHLGFDDNAAIDNDQQLAKYVDGIDVIIGGHSHTKLQEPVKIEEGKEPTVIVQAYQYGEYVGALDVSFDKKGVVTKYNGELIATADYKDDPEAAALLKPYQQKIAELQQTEIGVMLDEPLENPRTDGDLTKPSVRKNETVLGNLITDGMLAKARQYDEEVVMAFQNGGGIRSGINAGPVTVGEIINVLPFGNTLSTIRLTGVEIKEAFEHSVSAYPNENGGFLHVAGAKVVFDSTKPAGERIVSIQVQQQGNFTEIVDDKTYAVATNAFTAKGGDGYDMFAKAYQEGRVTDLGLSDWENFRDHLVGLNSIPTKIEGRITDMADMPESSSDILISEYIEGSSNNKAIELYNGTGKDVDLSDYRLELYTNGKTTVQNTQTFEGMVLKDEETLILVHAQANETLRSKGDMTSPVVNFNGDDVLLLKRGEEVIDSFGQLGFDPGEAWTEGEVSSQNKTLIRLSTSGDKNPEDAFDIANQWKALPIDTFDYLGSHDPLEEEPGVPSEQVSIQEARNAGIGKAVSIKGTVTAKLNNTFTVEDETAAITIYGKLDVAVGDVVTLTGTLGEYRNLLQMQDVTVNGKTSGTPLAPTVITGGQMNETNESKLVKLENVRVVAGGPNNFTIEVDGVQKVLRDESGLLGIEAGAAYESITGVIQQYNNDYQLLPRSAADIKLDSSVLRPVTASHTGGVIVGSIDVELTTSTAGAAIYYTLDGSDPREDGLKYTKPITINQDTVLKAVVKAADGAFSEVKTFEYEVTDKIRIHDIQGGNHKTSFANQTVQGIEGIVTYIFELKGAQYFTIQTPDEEVDNNPFTSEGIHVYAGSAGYDVKVGDKVAVTGTVSEYVYDGYSGDLTTTQINARNDRGGQVSILSSGNELPQAFIIDESSFNPSVIDNDSFSIFDPQEDAIDFWESKEGMRVSVTDVKAVAPQEYGDIVTVLQTAATDTKNGGVVFTEQDTNPERIQFRLEPNAAGARSFNVNTGDTFNGTITGVVGNSYTNYKIHADLSDVKAIHTPGNSQPETTTIQFAEDKLTVASYNLENFSNNRSETSDEKADRLAEAIGNGMNTPDIVGLTEVQDNNGSANDGTVSAAESYQRLIDLIKAKTGVTYAYANIDPENNQDGGAPGANIRVGFLYNPARVGLEGTPGKANEATSYENGVLTRNPGRIDPTNDAFANSRKPVAAQFTFNGESVIVIANHWNSKSGDTGLFGDTQPVVLGSETQRKKIARVVADFITEIKLKNENANIVALGDFNDYQFSSALRILETAGMHNKIKDLPLGDQYTYVYQGNSQVLDHILVTSNLARQTDIDVLHVNADFTEASGRASDHDPLMIQIDFSDDVSAASIVNIQEHRNE